MNIRKGMVLYNSEYNCFAVITDVMEFYSIYEYSKTNPYTGEKVEPRVMLHRHFTQKFDRDHLTWSKLGWVEILPPPTQWE